MCPDPGLLQAVLVLKVLQVRCLQVPHDVFPIVGVPNLGMPSVLVGCNGAQSALQASEHDRKQVTSYQTLIHSRVYAHAGQKHCLEAFKMPVDPAATECCCPCARPAAALYDMEGPADQVESLLQADPAALSTPSTVKARPACLNLPARSWQEASGSQQGTDRQARRPEPARERPAACLPAR